MKTLIILIVLTFTYSAMSQNMSVFDVDASNFPTIKAKFFAFDKDGNQITNLNPRDFEVKENGQLRNVTNVSCPTPQPPIALSSVLVFDISGSMTSGPPRIQSAKDAANAWINGLPLGQSECALVSFNSTSNIVQDFTTSRDKLKVAVEKLFPNGGTDYNQALIDYPAGGLQVAKNGKYKKVVVFLTDGLPNKEPKTAEIIKFANDNQITIYAVTLDMPAPQSIKNMTMQTGGQYFENITTQKEAEETYRKLLQLAQGGEPCEIEWESGAICISGLTNVEIGITNLGVNGKTSYLSPITSVAKLEINPSSVKFQNPEVGVKVEEMVTVTARNSDFTVTNITSNNAAFEIIPKSFTLNSGESIELTVSYLPSDSSYAYAQFEIESDICPIKYYASGGISGIKPKIKTIKLLHPNGGEQFVIGSDTVITWEGIPATETVKLEYSIDNGITWKTITDSASALKYIWKNIPRPKSKKCLVKISQNGKGNFAEFIPQIEWQKTFGGSKDEDANSIQQTNDGGYIVAGVTDSDDFDVVGKKGGGSADYWILKLNISGEIEWQKTMGTFYSEFATSIRQTFDNGYIVAGDSSNGKGITFSWILKLNSYGSVEWQKTYGGTKGSRARSIQQTKEGGYIFAGYTSSNDGDVSRNQGSSDYWIVKLNQFGIIEWEKTYGGTIEDNASSIQQTVDGGYIVAGTSQSKNGDVTGNQGGFGDYWIIKLDSVGTLEWQKTYGGSKDEEAYSIQQTKDGGYIVAGSSQSNDGDISSNHGTHDYWIIKLSSMGKLEWQNSYGGTEWDAAYSINLTFDGGYVVAGHIQSNNGDIDENKGRADFWIIKLNQIGELEWKKTLGGGGDDVPSSIQQTFEGGFIIAGHSHSRSGDVSGHHGGVRDMWIVKLSPEGGTILQSDVSDSVFSIVAPEPIANDIDMKQELVGGVKDSVVSDFIQNLGSWKFRVDSIYFRGTDADAFSLVSGFPQYDVEASQSHYAEIRFMPKRVGIHNAEIVIITQADTLIQNIRGEGVQPYLNLETELIDFGAVEINDYKDSIQVATIKNIGNAPLLITNTKHNYPNDVDFTTISGGGSFILKPNEIHKMDLRFSPSEVGRTSGTLEFHYDGVGSPSVLQLYGQGLGGKVIIPDDSAYAGDRIKVKLELGSWSRPKSNDLVTNYKFKLSYNPTILYCDEPEAIRKLDKEFETVEIVGKWDGKSNILGEFDFIAGLGKADTTNVILDEFHWLDKYNQIIDFDVEKQNGTFTLLGICEEGGTRLVNPYSKAGITSISPNPAENLINIQLSLTEFGNTELLLYNLLGEKVSTIYSESVSQKSVIELNSDISNIGSGQYLLIFRTPTYTETKQLMILK